MSIFVRLYTVLRGHTRGLFAGTALFLVICALFMATLVVREDITTLLPRKPQGLADQFALLRDAPQLQGLTIAVGGDDPLAAAKILADALRSPEIPHIVAGAEIAFAPSLITQFCAAVPGLMDADALARLPGLVDEQAVDAALRSRVQLMRSAQGIALRDLVALDPLGMCTSTLKTLMPKSDDSTVRFAQGSLSSTDGRYALVIAEPALPMVDTQAARTVMAQVRKALATLPPDTPTIVLGGHRHTEENSAVVTRDVQRILPLSLGLLILTYCIFVRTWRGLAIVLLPGAALLVAAAFTGIVWGSLSGIVLGFGSVLLGITADYAIHVYYAMRVGHNSAETLQRIIVPMLFGAATTLAAFLAFFFSSIPCIVQMSVFVAAGIVAAVGLALVVLPHVMDLRRTATEAVPTPCSPPRVIRSWPLFALWAVLGTTLVLLLWHIPINGDIRELSYISPAFKQDEATLRESFGGLRERGQLIVRGATMQEALAKNDALWAALRASAEKDGWNLSLVTSLAPILPAQATQRQRHAAWGRFWATHRDDTLRTLDAAAAKAGFSPEAFAPFRQWISDTPQLVTPDLLHAGGLDPVVMLARQRDKEALIYSLVQGDVLPPPVARIAQEHNAVFVSGATFRQSMDEATRSDLVRFGSISLLAVLGMSVALFRSRRRMGMTLLPVGVALCAVLGIFRLTDMSLNIFHAIALPLVICLSVDYGIFMLANLEGTLNDESRKAVLLSGLTTLSGFGVLMLAEHPALYSMGLSVSIGLAAALATAFALLPWLTRKHP